MARIYPVEILREGTMPAITTRIYAGFENAYMMNAKAWGVIAPALENNEPTASRFTCMATSDCHGELELTQGRSSWRFTKVVSARTPCSCLKFALDSNNSDKTLTDILIKKYETEEAAAHAIVGYILHLLCALPMRVDIDYSTKANNNTTAYNLWYEAAYVQRLKVKIEPNDGGFYIDQTLMNWCHDKAISCACCRHRNTFDENDCVRTIKDKRGRYYFQFNTCSHYICEQCVLPFYTKRKYETAAAYAVPYTENNRRYPCPTCKKATHSNLVKIKFTGPTNSAAIAAPVPVAFFGTKFVITKITFDALAGFFRRHIAWILPYYDLIQEAVENKEHEVERLFTESEDEEDQGGIPQRIHNQNLSRDCHEDLEILQNIKNFLDERSAYVEFAMYEDTPFPEEFLNLDSAYYETKLARSDMALLVSSLNDQLIFPLTFNEPSM